jgi:glycosyltransferase involved in cell wall biosynthesis
VPPDSRRAGRWHDGFTAAIECLTAGSAITWLNIHPDHPSHDGQIARLNDCDCLLAKSNWGWIVDDLVREHARRDGPPRALLISGTADPPRTRQMKFYDVLFFETHWYAPKLRPHPCSIHAFGIDTRVMRAEPRVTQDIDWLSVGAIRPYKRHELLLDRDGRRVVVADSSSADQAIVQRLRSGGVEVLDFVTYNEMAGYYRRARNVLVAASPQGGGERSVLEARACGTPVEVADDNPKLRELADQPVIWDHIYYATRLAEGIEAMCGVRPAVGEP